MTFTPLFRLRVFGERRRSTQGRSWWEGEEERPPLRPSHPPAGDCGHDSSLKWVEELLLGFTRQRDAPWRQT